MNKRFTTLMTTLILSVFFGISASAFDVEVDGIYYNVISENEVQVAFGSNRYSGNVIIPASILIDDVKYTVTSIEGSAFASCRSLTSVTIPNTVTSIESWAFSGCTGLTSFEIPNSVTTIERYTFSGCKSLTSVTIPNSVTNIQGFAFNDCVSLESIVIPNSVSILGGFVFNQCNSLTSVTIPNSINSIEPGLFCACSSLTSISIPNSVTSIGESAFSACKSLTSVTIPNTVTSIESKAFIGCQNIENLYCHAGIVPSTELDAFKSSNINFATLHVPYSAIDAYKTTSPWSEFGSIKTLEGTEIETKKCETPIISYSNGKLVFNCATEEVKYESEINSDDINQFYTDEIKLSAFYNISVTAVKAGYEKSDVATAKLYWLPSSATLETDNINTAAMRGIAIQSSGGFINISGLNTNERVDFYATDGKALGSATAINGSVSFSAQQGTIIIAKIGNESLKIAVE